MFMDWKELKSFIMVQQKCVLAQYITIISQQRFVGTKCYQVIFFSSFYTNHFSSYLPWEEFSSTLTFKSSFIPTTLHWAGPQVLKWQPLGQSQPQHALKWPAEDSKRPKFLLRKEVVQRPEELETPSTMITSSYVKFVHLLTSYQSLSCCTCTC